MNYFMHGVRNFCAATMFLTAAAIAASGSEPYIVFEGDDTRLPRQPQACIDADGVTHLTFGEGDQVFYCRCVDKSFESPRVVFTVPNMSLGMRRGPRIAVIDQSIVITAIGGPRGKGQDGDLLAYCSNDRGRTWSGPHRVNNVEGSAREGLHSMAATEAGKLMCVWLDLRSNKTEIYRSMSDDKGKSWNKNALVYHSPDGSVCECCHPSIVAKGDSIHIQFRNLLAGNRDMYLISSTDNGTSFGKAMQLGIQQWKLNACPMDGGMISIGPEGKVMSVWRRDGTIFTSKKNVDERPMNEKAFGTGEQAWIAANDGGEYVVWTTSREGDLMYSKVNSNKSEKLAERSRDPVIVSGPRSQPHVDIFWEQKIDGHVAIMGLRKVE